MLSKRYESTEVDRRTWLHVPSGTHWSTSSDTHQVVEIQIETSTKMWFLFSMWYHFLIIHSNSKSYYLWPIQWFSLNIPYNKAISPHFKVTSLNSKVI